MYWSHRGRNISVGAIAVLALAGTCHGSEDMKHIGGGWSIENVPRAPEAGIQPRNLLRTAGRRRQVVDEWIDDFRFYEPDCVVYQTARAYHHVFAVCGDRLPVAIASSMVTAWKLDAEGPRRTSPPQLQQGRLVQTTELLPIEQVKGAAMRQPPFQPGDRPVPFNQVSPPVPALTTEQPIDFRSSPAQGTPHLIEAAIAGRLEMINALLTAGADPNVPDSGGRTPLMYAAGNRQEQIVDRLIASGANVNAKNKRGETPLMAAADVGEKEIVKRLLAAGADAGIRDAKGRTAPDRIPSSRDSEMLELLRSAAHRKPQS